LDRLLKIQWYLG